MEFYYNETDKDVLIISADGGLNSDNADKFVNELAALIDAGQTKIVVDCSRLNNITSYGLGVLVRLHSKLSKKGGDVKLACVKGLIEQVFKVTHLNKIFEIYPDVSRACLMFRPKDAEG
ncbi:MAG: STAS domain-containing protein [Planctomycetota bacterium]|jgi:anti-sigma B factor antagonist